jgi:hypothetical protein
MWFTFTVQNKARYGVLFLPSATQNPTSRLTKNQNDRQKEKKNQ